MSEIKRLGLDMTLPRSINGIGLTRSESAVFEKMADPTEFVNNVIKTDGFNKLKDDEKKLTLQLSMDHFLEQAESNVFDTKNEEFKDLRNRIREAG